MNRVRGGARRDLKIHFTDLSLVFCGVVMPVVSRVRRSGVILCPDGLHRLENECTATGTSASATAGADRPRPWMRRTTSTQLGARQPNMRWKRAESQSSLISICRERDHHPISHIVRFVTLGGAAKSERVQPIWEPCIARSHSLFNWAL